jgi:hypothetical protein
MLEFPFAPLALIFSGRLVVERLAIIQQVRHDAGDLMCRGHRGLLGSEPGPDRMAWAAWRKAWGARLTTCSGRARTTRPPEMSWCGANPSHAQKGLTVGNVRRSVPVSATRVWAMAAEIPVTATSSTPVRRVRGARAPMSMPAAFGWLQGMSAQRMRLGVEHVAEVTREREPCCSAGSIAPMPWPVSASGRR